MTLEITSTAFAHNDRIPRRHTCEGGDVSPALRWSGVPQGANSLVLIVDDPDAPDPAAPKMTWVHWVVYNLPPDVGGLEEGVAEAALPDGARCGRNNFNRTRYGGPCPPIGRHRYFHKLYALDTTLTGLADGSKDEVLAAMDGHVLAQAELVGTYQKGD